MLNYRSRWYDAQLGRFISPDSIIPDGSPQSLNRYSNNNPINYNDPSGHWGINVGFNISGFLNNFWNSAGQFAGISNLSNKLVNVLDIGSLACDSLALAADSIVVAGDAIGAIIGGTSGAIAGGMLAGPEASPITGGPGAALGALMADAALKPLTMVGNALATLSTACTTESDFLTGDNNYSGTLSIGSKGAAFNAELSAGRDTITSLGLTATGWANPIGGLSLPGQALSVLNDTGMLYDSSGQAALGKTLTNLSQLGVPGIAGLGQAFSTMSYVTRQFPPRMNINLSLSY